MASASKLEGDIALPVDFEAVEWFQMDKLARLEKFIEKIIEKAAIPLRK